MMAGAVERDGSLVSGALQVQSPALWSGRTVLFEAGILRQLRALGIDHIRTVGSVLVIARSIACPQKEHEKGNEDDENGFVRPKRTEVIHYGIIGKAIGVLKRGENRVKRLFRTTNFHVLKWL